VNFETQYSTNLKTLEPNIWFCCQFFCNLCRYNLWVSVLQCFYVLWLVCLQVVVCAFMYYVF